MTIPPFIVFACAVAVLLLIGGLIHTAYKLGVRVKALEDRQPQVMSPMEVVDTLTRCILREPE